MSDDWDLSTAAFKRMKETYKSKDLVIPALERHVMRRFQEDNNVGRRMDVIHPSSMAKKDWCPRKDWYVITGHETSHKVANPGFAMSNVLTNGHEIHHKYQGWFREMGTLYGDWDCVLCNHRWTALSPDVCPECDTKLIAYAEVPLHRSPTHIHGNSDGALHNHGVSKFTGLLEVKSVGIGTLRFEAPRLYDSFMEGNETIDTLGYKINRPFPSHIRQGQLYLWLAWPRYERIVYIYEYKWNQRVKEFVVEYNPKIIAPLIEQAKELSEHIDNNTLPDRPVWAIDKQVRECSTCEYRNHCWSKDDETQDPAAPVSLRVTKASASTRRSALSKT